MKQMFSYKPRVLKIMIHVIGWGIVFGFPFLMMSRSGFNITWESYLRHGCGVPIAFCLVFYINYCILIPRYLFSGKIKHYLALNLLLIAAATTGIHLWQELSFHLFSETDADKKIVQPQGNTAGAYRLVRKDGRGRNYSLLQRL